MLRSLLGRIGLLTLMCLAVPAAALAQSTTAVEIDGSPLNIFTNPDGRTQVNLDGAPSEFFPPGSPDFPSTSANAGFGLVLHTGGAYTDYGVFNAGSLPTPDSGPSLTPGNPATLTTVWTLNDQAGAPAIRLTQVLSYANGSRQVEATYTAQNLTAGAIPVRALWAADLAIRGSDSGVGFLTGTAPNRFMGGLNQDVGAAGGFVEETPWSAFMSDQLGTVGIASRDYAGPGFTNSISTQPADNAAGVQWDDHSDNNPIPGNTTVTWKVGLKFVDTLGLSPLTAIEQTGNEHVITAKLGDLNGNAAAGQKLVYSVVGANVANGTATTGSDGTAQISYVGGNPGEDTVTVFNDSNNNGTRDTNESQAQATVTWQGASAPQIGVTATVRPEKGTVTFKPPKNFPAAKLKALGIQPAASGFQKLTGSESIPIGSTLNTTKGTVRLLTAANTSSFSPNAFQAASFSGGLFSLSQGKKSPLTTLSMGGGSLNSCGTPVPKGGAAKIVAAATRKRRLSGSGRGRFRTRGRNSSATVRGTTWTMTDTCKGTLTVVKQGSVTVRDFTLKKNKTVKAGHRYLARPPKRRH